MGRGEAAAIVARRDVGMGGWADGIGARWGIGWLSDDDSGSRERRVIG